MAYKKFVKPMMGIMPEHSYRSDIKWINEQLSCLNDIEREKISLAYSKAYSKAFDEEPLSHKKTGAARREANTRLRVFIKKRSAVFNRP